MTEGNLSELLRPELREHSAYLPEPGHFAVRLDANEAPPLLSAGARQRLAEVAAGTAWERYPDATATALREAIAAHMGLCVEEILVGVGSDELITLLLTAVAEGRKSSRSVLTTAPTFVMYRLSAKLRGLPVLEVPLDAAWGLADKSLEAAVSAARPALAFIASPNNPTGTMAASEPLVRLIEALPDALVVIDEAYVNYASRSQVELYRRYPNVVLLRTLSKVGFAALRVGWLVGRPALVSELNKLRLPYNVGALSQALGRLALTELWPEVSAITARVVEARERLAQELGGLGRYVVTPSEANFLWVKTPGSAQAVFSGLQARGILVRSFHDRGGRLANQLRITVGTEQENTLLLEALAAPEG